MSGKRRRHADDSVIIEFEIEKRNIRRDGKPVTIRILRYYLITRNKQAA